jgi:hypothetical protein
MTELATDPFGGAIGTGDVITGYYTFDSATADVQAGTDLGSYIWNGSPYGVHVDIGSYSFDYDDATQIMVRNNCGHGSIDPVTGCGPVEQKDTFQVISLEQVTTDITNVFYQYLIDDTLIAFSDDSLPLTTPSLSDFTRTDGTIVSRDESDFRSPIYNYWIDYDLTSLSLRTASVPEPYSLLLMGIGLAGLGFTRKRKQT